MTDSDLRISHTTLKMLEDFLNKHGERKDVVSIRQLQEDIKYFKIEAEKIIEDN